jgi:hypothetical protein
MYDTYLQDMRDDLAQGLLWHGGLYCFGNDALKRAQTDVDRATLYLCTRAQATVDGPQCLLVNLQTGNVWTEPFPCTWHDFYPTTGSTVVRARVNDMAYIVLTGHAMHAVAVNYQHLLQLRDRQKAARKKTKGGDHAYAH